MRQKLFLAITLLLFAKGFSQTTAYTPPNMVTCGNEVYDLTTQNEIVLGNQDPENFMVSYFTSLSNAQINQEPILDPTFYVLDWNEQQSNTIYVRVSNLMDGSFDITHFEVTMLLNSSIAQLSPLTGCDVNNDGFAVFNLNDKVAEILAGNPSGEVFFYETVADAEAGTNAITNTSAYTNSIAIQQTIYVRLTTLEGCDAIGEFDIIAAICTGNVLTGTITFDSDNDGCTAGDLPAAGIMVSYTHANDVYYTFTDANGEYTFMNVPDGANFVHANTTGAIMFDVIPGSHTVNFPGDGSGNDFCLTMPNSVNDVSVMLYPTSTAIPGFSAGYVLVYQNMGNLASSGVISLQFDNNLVTYIASSPAMAAMGSNMLTLNYNNLMPFQSGYVYLTFEVMQPGTVDSGDILPYTVTIDATTDENPDNNNFDLNQIVVNAYDPNDIRCHEGEMITEEQTENYLHYTIRFQNEGDGEAINIRVETELDEKLDMDTFVPVGASHDYITERTGNTVKFIFNDINLTYADNDFEASQGYIMYKVKTESDATIGDIVEAEAGIYFNFNEPIYTNEYSTTIGATAGVTDVIADSFVIYPNPASSKITLQMKNILDADVTVTDVLGKTVIAFKVQGAQLDIDVSSLNSGLYFVKVAAGGKSVTKKLVVK